MAALDAIGDICRRAKIHACGYCLGGTLLAIAAAAMARDNDDRSREASRLFCAQTDFSEPGELQVFITEDQLDVSRRRHARAGLSRRAPDGRRLSFLRSNDLVWSRLVKSYLAR